MLLNILIIYKIYKIIELPAKMEKGNVIRWIQSALPDTGPVENGILDQFIFGIRILKIFNLANLKYLIQNYMGWENLNQESHQKAESIPSTSRDLQI